MLVCVVAVCLSTMLSGMIAQTNLPHVEQTDDDDDDGVQVEGCLNA